MKYEQIIYDFCNRLYLKCRNKINELFQPFKSIKYKNYKKNVLYYRINVFSKISLMTSICLFLFSISYSLSSLEIINIDSNNKSHLKQSLQLDKEIINSKYQILKDNINQLNSRIDNIYMWGIVFASLMFAVGFYQMYSSRKVAEEIAKSELYDLRETKDRALKDIKDVATNIAKLKAKNELFKDEK